MITTIGCMYTTAERSVDTDRMFLAMATTIVRRPVRDLDALDAVAAPDSAGGGPPQASSCSLSAVRAPT